MNLDHCESRDLDYLAVYYYAGSEEDRAQLLQHVASNALIPAAKLMQCVKFGDWDLASSALRNPNLSQDIWTAYCFIDPTGALQNPSIALWMLESMDFITKLEFGIIRALATSYMLQGALLTRLLEAPVPPGAENEKEYLKVLLEAPSITEEQKRIAVERLQPDLEELITEMKRLITNNETPDPLMQQVGDATTNGFACYYEQHYIASDGCAVIVDIERCSQEYNELLQKTGASLTIKQYLFAYLRHMDTHPHQPWNYFGVCKHQHPSLPYACNRVAYPGSTFCKAHIYDRWHQGLLSGETSRCCLVKGCSNTIDESKATTCASLALCEDHQKESGLGSARFAKYLLHFFDSFPQEQKAAQQDLAYQLNKILAIRVNNWFSACYFLK